MNGFSAEGAELELREDTWAGYKFGSDTIEM